MTMTQDNRITGSMMRIRGQHPFFGTLALYAEIIVSEKVKTAATDGIRLWINPEFSSSLSPDQLAGLLVHEILHMALLHCARRLERDPHIWNIAADIVVNETIINDTDYALPEGAITDAELGQLSVEEVYEQLRQRKNLRSLIMPDLLPAADTAEGSDLTPLQLEEHWKSAMHQASAIAQKACRGYGKQGFGGSREIDALLEPKLSWRELLWQHVVTSPFDFEGFDRRFIWQGLYLDGMSGETIEIAIAIDTSGSIFGEELTLFMSEIQGIMDTYPHIKARLYYADTKLYGPYDADAELRSPNAQGGGGTSFLPFFKAIKKDTPDVCIYLTDGYGDFPSSAPECETIWVISPGGIVSSDIPFGVVVRMSE